MVLAKWRENDPFQENVCFQLNISKKTFALLAASPNSSIKEKQFALTHRATWSYWAEVLVKNALTLCVLSNLVGVCLHMSSGKSA